MSRGQRAALLLVLLGAAGLLLAGGRTWGHVDVPPGLGLVRRVDLTGEDLSAGGYAALGLGGLAGLGGLLATRGWGRVAVGVVVALLGLGALVDAALGVVEGSAFAGRSERLTSVVPDSSLDLPDVHLTAWPLVALLAAVLLLAGGVLAAATARAARGLPSRYERPGGAGVPGGAVGPAAPQVDPADDAAVWRALDEGDDPTDRGGSPAG